MFMGFQLSPHGVSTSPSMVEAIIEMPKPSDQHAVQRYLGMLKFLARFCPKLTDVVKSLRHLTHKDAPLKWTDAHDKAFVASKNLIAHAPVLRYFNAQLPVTLQVHTSAAGVGGALQDNQPVEFYLNTLTATEQRYAIIEKQCLAICLAFEKWDSLLYGKSDITVETNHQPLETIFYENPLQSTKASASHAHEAPRMGTGCELQERSTLSHSRRPLKGSSSAGLCSQSLWRTHL